LRVLALRDEPPGAVDDHPLAVRDAGDRKPGGRHVRTRDVDPPAALHRVHVQRLDDNVSHSLVGREGVRATHGETSRQGQSARMRALPNRERSDLWDAIPSGAKPRRAARVREEWRAADTLTSRIR
jgi:hypothetical protein